MDFLQQLSGEIQQISMMIMLVNVFIHIIFAGAVARDAGQLHKTGMPTCLVSGVTWAFATLVGGIFIAVTYWLLHHVKFPRL